MFKEGAACLESLIAYGSTNDPVLAKEHRQAATKHDSNSTRAMQQMVAEIRRQVARAGNG